MTRIVADLETSKQLIGVKDMAEICDPSGKLLGRFLPVPDLSEWDLTEPPISEEELRRIEQDPVSYSTAEVLEYLKKL
jgi:hypothetical protein